MVILSYMNANILVGIAMMLLTIYFLLLNQVSKHVLTIYFWIHAFTYIAISTLFIFEDYLISFNTDPLKAIAFDFTYTNFPLYFLSSLCLIGSYILFDYLAQRHDVAKIIALSQISMIISTIGYHFLGDRMTVTSVMCITIIITGALISGLTRFSLRHPIASLKEYDRRLVVWSILNAWLIAIPELITYLCTAHQDPTTQHILKMLTKHTHGIPFMTVIPLYMNIGIQCFNMALLFSWIRHTTKQRHELLITIKTYKKLLIILAALHVGYVYCYYTAFDSIENKNIISSIIQLYLPLTMLGSTVIFHQKWNKFEAVGMSIIAVGAMISVATSI